MTPREQLGTGQIILPSVQRALVTLTAMNIDDILSSIDSEIARLQDKPAIF